VTFAKRSINNQKGAVLIESALTIALFLVLVIGTFEIALLFFDWNRSVEATRAVARTLVVSTPPVNLESLSCEDEASSIKTFKCNESGVDCGPAMERALGIAPKLVTENVRVTYRCSSAGFSGRPDAMPIFSLTAELEGFTSELRVPALAGFPVVLNMPGFQTTRITEDLYTPPTE
jgi:Flp pilus assembly protein TadG